MPLYTYFCAPEKNQKLPDMLPKFAVCLLIWSSINIFSPCSLLAQDTPTSRPPEDSTHKTQRVNLHFQTTYIYQYKPAFNAPYSGQNSLSSATDKENSVTATLFAGIRLWKGGELYINPEIAGGSGLSGAYGLAASTNGETFRVGDPAPTLYLARGFLKQTFALGSDKSFLDDGANQLATNDPKNYLRFLIGKMSLGDVFDNNAYANSPRTQFLNWCLMNTGAWDYAANLRGYTYALVTILQQGTMSYKAALAAMPVVANGLDLNTNLNQEYAINAEVDRQIKINKLPGTIRVIGYYNDGHMGNYSQALKHPDSNGIPDIISTRQYGRTKTGLILNTDQQIGKFTGIFFRAGWNDGKNETWAFTEADRSVSAGLSVNGGKWKRKDDNLGVALDVNGLSQIHQQYLAAGGLGFQLGDGKLNYAYESAFELYYSYKALPSGIWLSGDYQFVLNPGYNSDRGPVNVFSLRVHVEL
jgi:high affinity Mn2+ porin